MTELLYTLEHSVAFDIIFGLFFVIMTIMFALSLITIYRANSSNLKKSVIKLNHVRYITTFCILVQYLTFTGYYLELILLHELLWNIWIPCFTFAFALLSYNISNIYLDTVNMSNKRKQYKAKLKSITKASSKLKARLKLKLSSPRYTSSSNKIQKHQHKFELVEVEPDKYNTTTTTDTEESYEFSSSMAQELDWSPNNSEIELEHEKESENNISYHCTPRVIPRRLSNSQSYKAMKKKIKPIFWKFIWFFWIICSLIHWIGFIAGYVFQLYVAQTFCYMFWKLITFCMLLLCQYILYIVKRRLEYCLEGNKNETGTNSGTGKLFRNLKVGRKKIKSLILCECILSIFLFVSCIYQIYILSKLMEQNGEGDNGDILTQPTILSMMIYFPVWTSIHIVLLVYSWINKNDITRKSRKHKKNDNKSNSSSNLSKRNGVKCKRTKGNKIESQHRKDGNNKCVPQRIEKQVTDNYEYYDDLKQTDTDEIEFDVEFDMDGECVLVGIDRDSLDDEDEKANNNKQVALNKNEYIDRINTTDSTNL